LNLTSKERHTIYSAVVDRCGAVRRPRGGRCECGELEGVDGNLCNATVCPVLSEIEERESGERQQGEVAELCGSDNYLLATEIDRLKKVCDESEDEIDRLKAKVEKRDKVIEVLKSGKCPPRTDVPKCHWSCQMCKSNWITEKLK
jgi:hypothetical protein